MPPDIVLHLGSVPVVHCQGMGNTEYRASTQNGLDTRLQVNGASQ